MADSLTREIELRRVALDLPEAAIEEATKAALAVIAEWAVDHAGVMPPGPEGLEAWKTRKAAFEWSVAWRLAALTKL